MAQVTVTVPDPWGPIAIAAECANHGYQAQIPDGDGNLTPNPETPFQFVVRYRIKYIKDNLKAYLVPPLALADRQPKVDEIDAVQITIVPVP